MGFLVDLLCTRTGKAYPKDQLWNLSPEANAPLFARYDLAAVAKALRRENLAARPPTMWRYAEVLPVEDAQFQVSLGEGFTPLLQAESMGRKIGVPNLYIKDEGLNPTGSFKARGMSAAISRAAELGASAIAIPSAGNAGGATAAYAARAGFACPYFYAQRRAPSQLRGVQSFGRAGRIGRWVDFGLRKNLWDLARKPRAGLTFRP